MAVMLLQEAGMEPVRLLFQSSREVRLGHLPASAQSMGSCPSNRFCCKSSTETFCTMHQHTSPPFALPLNQQAYLSSPSPYAPLDRLCCRPKIDVFCSLHQHTAPPFVGTISRNQVKRGVCTSSIHWHALSEREVQLRPLSLTQCLVQ